ncbi:MAG: STAS domain-containing protein [Armatimonadota bacterium]
MAEISIDIRTVSDVPVVQLNGELDIDQAVRVREHLDKVMDGGALRLIIDLSDVSYIDSTGLGMLVAVHKRLVAEQGFYVLTVPRASQRKVFEITGLSTVLVIMQSLEEALARIIA